MTEFDRECIERIPPHEMGRISETVRESVEKLWGNPNAPLVTTTCDSCPGPSIHKRTRRCLCSPLTGTAICAECWAREREANLCRQYLEEHRPKLDPGDFARL